jgi:hypothetical protein
MAFQFWRGRLTDHRPKPAWILDSLIRKSQRTPRNTPNEFGDPLFTCFRADYRSTCDNNIFTMSPKTNPIHCQLLLPVKL